MGELSRQGICGKCGKPSSLLTSCECVAGSIVRYEMGLLINDPVSHGLLHVDGAQNPFASKLAEWTDQEILQIELHKQRRLAQRMEDAKVCNNAGLVGYLIWLYRKFRWAMHNSKYFNDIGKDFSNDNKV